MTKHESLVEEPFEEGEPERITEPDAPPSPEFLDMLEEHGIPLSDWQPTKPWKPAVLAKEAELIGDPPTWTFGANAEYAPPGTRAWCDKARDLIRRMAAELTEPSGV